MIGAFCPNAWQIPKLLNCGKHWKQIILLITAAAARCYEIVSFISRECIEECQRYQGRLLTVLFRAYYTVCLSRKRTDVFLESLRSTVQTWVSSSSLSRKNSNFFFLVWATEYSDNTSSPVLLLTLSSALPFSTSFMSSANVAAAGLVDSTVSCIF